MPIFKCEKCNMVENTAVSNFWTRPKGSPALCSECDPGIGKWHGRFERMSADGFVQKGDYLVSKEEDAFERELKRAMENVPKIEKSDPEYLAKFFFTAGWRTRGEFGKE